MEDETKSTSKQPRISSADHGSIIIFDGGTGREIERRGGPFRQPEWSALALYENPHVVRQVHSSYIEAGATAITTNSYAIVPFHLGQERYEKDAAWLLKLSVDLVQQAIDETSDCHKEKVSILGSIPPLCGSYEPDKFDKGVAGPILHDFLKAFRDRVEVLLLETVGSIEEARFYLKTIQEDMRNHWKKRVHIWISFCIKSDYGMCQTPRLLTGETLQDAFEQLGKNDALLTSESVPVVLVNCCDLRLVSESIQQLVSVLPSTFRVGAYPNAFSVPPPDAANHTLRQVDFNITPQMLKEQATEWIQHGATVLGGCCGVGPEHIKAMASLNRN